MNISTLLRLVVPGTGNAENETAAKPAANESASVQSNTVLEGRETASPGRPAKAHGTPASRSARPPSPPGPKTDGAYRYGGRAIADAAPASPGTARTFPSLKALEARYPHVLGKIRAAWSDPRAFDLLMSELLLPDRPGRDGFDPDAALELTRLQEHYAATVAKADDSRGPRRLVHPER